METGLHQNWNRDYAPGIGRYIQADPIGLVGGLNVYQYTYNDPFKYIDPSGEIPVVPIIWGGYLRCVARCTARATAWDALTGEIDCWHDTLQDNVKGCAMSCANPLNYFKLTAVKNARQQISKWYSTRKRAKEAARRKGIGSNNWSDAYGKDGNFHDKIMTIRINKM